MLLSLLLEGQRGPEIEELGVEELDVLVDHFFLRNLEPRDCVAKETPEYGNQNMSECGV